MYIFDDMINMGLKENQEWPSIYHEGVAKNLLLCNPMVTTRDTLTEGVQWVLSHSEEWAKTVTIEQIIADNTRPFSLNV